MTKFDKVYVKHSRRGDKDAPCGFCAGKGCDECDNSGLASVRYQTSLACWCGDPAMRLVHGIGLCLFHARYVHGGVEIIKDQFRPHEEELHLWPEHWPSGYQIPEGHIDPTASSTVCVSCNQS